MKMNQIFGSPSIHKKHGYLDYMYSIFKARGLPVVLVEESALRWMGLRVSPYEVNITPSSPSCCIPWLQYLI